LSFQIDQTASYGPRLRLYGHQKPTTNHPTNIHLYYAGKITREATLELTIKCVTNFLCWTWTHQKFTYIWIDTWNWSLFDEFMWNWVLKDLNDVHT